MSMMDENKENGRSDEGCQVPLNTPGFWQGTRPGCNPILGLETIRNTMNELVVDIFYQIGKAPIDVPWQPEIDMYADNDLLFIEMGLPGARKEDLQIHSTSDLLIVQGKVSNSPDLSHGQYYIRERKTGSFSCSVPLPFQVETERITAHLREGLLTITLPVRREKPTSSVKVEIE